MEKEIKAMESIKFVKPDPNKVFEFAEGMSDVRKKEERHPNDDVDDMEKEI